MGRRGAALVPFSNVERRLRNVTPDLAVELTDGGRKKVTWQLKDGTTASDEYAEPALCSVRSG